MFKFITILYLVLFVCYVLFTRHPDYFDGEKTTATIHFKPTTNNRKTEPTATFLIGNKAYTVNVSYLLRNVKEGENVTVIYEASNPLKASLYSIWGYWILWDELLFSVAMWIILFQIAIGINKNPTPEA